MAGIIYLNARSGVNKTASKAPPSLPYPPRPSVMARAPRNSTAADLFLASGARPARLCNPKDPTVSLSILEKHRKQYQPKVPPSLRQGIAKVKVVEGAAAEPPK